MLRHFAIPFVVCSVVSVAAVAQQPPGNPQYGNSQNNNALYSNPQYSNPQYNNPQSGNPQSGSIRPGQPAQQPPQQQPPQQQQFAQQQPGMQQPAFQQPVQRTASANSAASGGPGSAPVNPLQGNSPIDRAALEQQLAAQQAAMAAQLAKMPFEPLNAPQQDYLDKVLTIWETNTAKIQRYQCNFRRWIYDPAQNTGNDAAAKGEGAIRFMQPDKGLFRVDKIEFFAGRDDKQTAIYRENERQKLGEYWLCDGEYVHILDRNDKKCLKVQLPPEMRGNQIHLSPLPFLFGVKAKEIKERYWVRPIAPPAGSRDVVLETYPKRPDDAGNYSRVQITLDSTDVLPKGLVVFLPNFRPEAPHREVYEFTDRDKDWNMLDQMKDKLFREEFIPKTLPKDWEIVVEPYLAPQQSQGQPLATQQPDIQQPNLQPGVAQQPTNPQFTQPQTGQPQTGQMRTATQPGSRLK